MGRNTAIVTGVVIVVLAVVLGFRTGFLGSDDTTLDGNPAALVGGQAAAAGGDRGQNATPDSSSRVQAANLARYEIDPAQSEVYWRVYRAGPAARLGHSHVISVGELSGSIGLAAELAQSEWELRIPVAALIVDDPEIRARHGAEFESQPSDDDKAGTKTNMLSDRLLNGEVYQDIRLQGVGFAGTAANAILPVSIAIVGQSLEFSFPAQIVVSGDSITVTGEYQLTHADLGLEPFSAAGGLMRVGDEIDFTYRLHALAVGR